MIVASPCGGTGGGMVTDVAFLARQLAEALPEGDEHGSRGDAGARHQPQSAAAGAGGGEHSGDAHRAGTVPSAGAVFPGDPACGLKAREAGSGALDAAYLIHAGEELSPQQMDAASDRVAEFLMLDTVTPAGNLLEACRLEEGETPGLQAAELWAVSIRLCPRQAARRLGQPHLPSASSSG